MNRLSPRIARTWAARPLRVCGGDVPLWPGLSAFPSCGQALMLGAAMLPLSATAQQIGARPAPSPCVAVDIGGQRAGHLDCAARRLQDAATIAREQAGAGLKVDVPRAGASDVRVGVSSLSGARLRMGGNLGRSVYPARPVAAPVNPLGRR